MAENTWSLKRVFAVVVPVPPKNEGQGDKAPLERVCVERLCVRGESAPPERVWLSFAARRGWLNPPGDRNGDVKRAEIGVFPIEAVEGTTLCTSSSEGCPVVLAEAEVIGRMLGDPEVKGWPVVLVDLRAVMARSRPFKPFVISVGRVGECEGTIPSSPSFFTMPASESTERGHQ